MTDRWQGASVLVTGARGFIGTELCRRLLEAGATVHGVSRVPNGVNHARMHGLHADLDQIAEVRRLIGGCAPDFVFHLAGYVTGSQHLEAVLRTFSTNLVSTVNLLTAAAERRDCRVILAGSMQEPDPKQGLHVPSSPYAASKWACSAYASMFHVLYQLRVVVARPMLVYGPGQWDRSKLLPSVIESLLANAAPRLTSGTREMDWVYIEDVADGLMAVAAAPGVEGRTIDLGSGQLTSIRSVVEELRDIIGCGVAPLFGALPDRSFEFPRVANVAEARRLTGWSATTPLSSGLARMVDWHRRLLAAERLGVSTGESHA